MSLASLLISRLAPTPSGFLHLGNAFNMILCWLWVRANGGQLYLRIDDIDGDRTREEYIEDIFRSLEWLGLDYDFGPTGPSDFSRFSQLNKLEEYQSVLDKLWEEDKLFACTCSRKALRASPDGLYPGTCKSQEIDRSQAGTNWRIHTPKNCIISWEDLETSSSSIDIDQSMRDMVLRRKNGMPAYQLVSLLEDIKAKVNLIVRGEDLSASTAFQLWLSRQLAPNTFVKTHFLHHALITSPGGEKLSKSAGATSLKAIREKGESAAIVFQQFTQWRKWRVEANTLDELLDLFRETLSNTHNH